MLTIVFVRNLSLFLFVITQFVGFTLFSAEFYADYIFVMFLSFIFYCVGVEGYFQSFEEFGFYTGILMCISFVTVFGNFFSQLMLGMFTFNKLYLIIISYLYVTLVGIFVLIFGCKYLGFCVDAERG